jgi:anti-anti-sigma regulatory factor
MFLATSNKTKALLHLSYIAQVTVEDLQRGQEDVMLLLADLPADFRMLADLSSLEFMDPACVEELGKIMDLLDQRGLKQVVRVIPDPAKDIGFKILEVFHYPHRPRTMNCKTMIEAARILAL